jgi:hypothetical protein
VYAANWGCSYHFWGCSYHYYHHHVDRVGGDETRAHDGTGGCGSEGGDDDASEGCHACVRDDTEADDPARDHAAGNHAAQTFEPVRITCVA